MSPRSDCSHNGDGMRRKQLVETIGGHGDLWSRGATEKSRCLALLRQHPRRRKMTSTSVPSLGWLESATRRDWLRRAPLSAAIPDPVPPRFRELASWRNGSSAASTSWSFMPIPVSRTRNATSPRSVKRRRDDHLAARIGELDGVGYQIEHDLRTERSSATTDGSFAAKLVRITMRSRAACGCSSVKQLDTRSLRLTLVNDRSIRPASTFARSRRSLTRLMTWAPKRGRPSGIPCNGRYPTGPKRSSSITSAKPRMALSGVRISWLILARRSDFCALASSAARRGSRPTRLLLS